MYNKIIESIKDEGFEKTAQFLVFPTLQKMVVQLVG